MFQKFLIIFSISSIFTTTITLARPQQLATKILPPKQHHHHQQQQQPLASVKTPEVQPTFVKNPNYVPNEFEVQQNRAARYQFMSNIEDHINDQSQQRTEMREGLKVTGSYSYSDGYYKRTVHYEADENGYRITGEESAPLDGPNIDLMGTASISNAAHGTHTAYRIQSVPVPGPVPKIIN